MEDDIVVVTPLSESRKILTGFGSVVIVELDDNRTLRDRQKINYDSGFLESYHCRLKYDVCCRHLGREKHQKIKTLHPSRTCTTPLL